METIVSQGGLVFGLGHGSMAGAVKTSHQITAPHNYYIYVLGNSGILAVLALLAFQFALFQQAFQHPDRQARAALLAIATVWAVYQLVDNVLMDHPTVGGIFACVVVSIAYARSQKVARLRGAARAAFPGRQALAGSMQFPLARRH